MWIQAHITVPKSEAEAVEALLEELGALSVTLADAADEPMFEPPLGTTPLWHATRVTGLFPGETDLDSLRSKIDQALASSSVEVQIETLEDRDWERAWLERFRPMRFGRRLWVCPSGTSPDQPDAVVVQLDPGLAFGTGTHPTTALCLEWLDGADLEGRRVVDFGCGSGILAVAAARLGAARVTAVDHDPQALLATSANARNNGVETLVDIRGSGQTAPEPAEVVVANILANVLVELAPRLGATVAPSGTLVLSGVLAGQAEEVMAAYAATFDFEAPAHREGWVRLCGRRLA